MARKQQLGLRVEESLKAGLQEQARRSGRAETAILEEYILAGLARDTGELIEQNSLPAIRQAIREVAAEEVNKAIAQLYQQLSVDLTKAAQRSDNRLAALIVKAARWAGIGQRLTYALYAKQYGPQSAASAFEDASEKAGKDLARPDQS